jgi:hypothetical protein
MTPDGTLEGEVTAVLIYFDLSPNLVIKHFTWTRLNADTYFCPVIKSTAETRPRLLILILYVPNWCDHLHASIVSQALILNYTSTYWEVFRSTPASGACIVSYSEYLTLSLAVFACNINTPDTSIPHHDNQLPWYSVREIFTFKPLPEWRQT